MSYIGQKVVIDVREVMFRKFQRMPMAYFDKHQTGETMSYITNDVSAIQSALVDQLIEMVTEGSILIGSIVMMVVPADLDRYSFGRAGHEDFWAQAQAQWYGNSGAGRGYHLPFAGEYFLHSGGKVLCSGRIRNQAVY